MSFVLTPENYYSHDRPHVSMSMIKDYMKSPAFYKRRYVDRDPRVQVVPTDAMKRGTVVDDLLTRGTTNIQPRVKKVDDAELFAAQKDVDDKYLIGQSYWDEAMEIAEEVKKSPLWHNCTAEGGYEEYQHILQGELFGLPVCGMADRIDGRKQDFEIIDLKVVGAAKIESAQKWLYNVIDMKYAHQFALYQYLFAKEQEIEPKEISCRHVVASYVEPGLVQVKSYLVPQKLIDSAFTEIETALQGIAAGNFENKVPQIEDLPYF